MRKLIEKQLKIGQVDICDISVDVRCRDEIPQVLLGLQAIYGDVADHLSRNPGLYDRDRLKRMRKSGKTNGAMPVL